MRSASADTEIRGRHIRAGDRLMLLYGSANRDEEVFENPDVFNVERAVKHVAFGTGPHTCVGMHLAKLEMRIMFEELLPRIRGIELTGKRSSPSRTSLAALNHACPFAQGLRSASGRGRHHRAARRSSRPGGRRYRLAGRCRRLGASR